MAVHQKLSLITKDVLPKTVGPKVSWITGQTAFPVAAYTITEPVFWIDYTGSVFQLFRMKEFSLSLVSDILAGLDFDASVQIYKYKNTHYIAVKSTCVIPDLHKHLFKILSIPVSARKLNRLITEKTTLVVSKLKRTLGNSVEPVEFDKDPLINWMCDLSLSSDWKPCMNDIAVNLSAAKITKNRYAASVSIQSSSTLPAKRDILKDCDHVQMISIVKPNKDRNDNILERMNSTLSLLDTLSRNNASSVTHVDTMQSSDAAELCRMIHAGVYYYDCSIFLQNDSLSTLNKDLSNLISTMEDNGIELYCHTHSGFSQYVSLFPGNAHYGEHYYTAMRPFLPLIIDRFMSL